MLTVYQIDDQALLQGDAPHAREAPTKGHLQVLIAPPTVPAGHAARWVTALHPVIDTKTYGNPGTGSWEVIEDHRKDTLWLGHGKPYVLGEDADGKAYDGLGPVPEWLYAEEPPAPEPTLAELRAAKQAAATAKRWEVMTGGITLQTGVRVGTSIDDQNRITSVVANAALAGLQDTDEVDFKAETGWVRVTVADVKQIAGAIGQFVQACYTAERVHHDAIAALPDDRAAIEGYDVSAGWPESGGEA
ncbi:hypothetical protein GCM10009125_28770 [Castellaniella daejeonensis]|uniref:DUF4376 domain-containing protein n=1 Tax=Castellaniella daejeonensis TaxID=659013 RepID=A0ABP3DT32_9BURK